MHKKLDSLALILFCGLIFFLSDQSRLPTPNWFENEDKLHHYLAYGVMGILAWRAFRHIGISRVYVLLISFVFCSLYGISDEWHQSFVVGRNSSANDWLADNIGAATGIIFCYWRHKHRTNNQVLPSVS
ncbi:VanZ family protein [Methylomonas paludis]|uniref:VanZ family protein n=1 Tax=Methylomonas paludis TaxID=1173101 RepID=A0A975MPX7_9GAMM|nr:VanZ family protein [Methylomonas paludis]QWF71624.1 VanZ family protein [Methylomonas paludis]